MCEIIVSGTIPWPYLDSLCDRLFDVTKPTKVRVNIGQEVRSDLPLAQTDHHVPRDALEGMQKNKNKKKNPFILGNDLCHP